MIQKIRQSLLKPRIVPRLWKRILSYFYFEQWAILASTKSVGYKDVSWKNFKLIAHPADRDWADPFIWVQNGKYFIFIEEKPYSTKIGRIICLALDENMDVLSSHIVLEKPFHLSYPYLFEYKEQLYMVPETKDNRTIDLYRCTNFPYHWEFARNLLSDVEAVDASLIEKDGKWWLFANIVNDKGVSWDTLHLYMAPHPLADEWVAHPKNPIIKDIHSARPAGRIFLDNGNLIRPSQDCSVRYGYATNFNRIVTLDETDYSEVCEKTFMPPKIGNILGTHTYNSMNGFTLIDAKQLRRKF